MTYRITDIKAKTLLSLNQKPSLCILVDIRMSNGVHVSQKNLSDEGLKSLVEKPEVLC